MTDWYAFFQAIRDLALIILGGYLIGKEHGALTGVGVWLIAAALHR